MASTESRLSRLLTILETREEQLRKKSTNGFIIREMLINTILAGTVGYFLAKILDHHLHQHKT